jgi:hypothetical protein
MDGGDTVPAYSRAAVPSSLLVVARSSFPVSTGRGARMKAAELLEPVKLWEAAEVLTRPSPVPAAAGTYGWHFTPCLHPNCPLTASPMWGSPPPHGDPRQR